LAAHSVDSMVEWLAGQKVEQKVENLVRYWADHLVGWMVA
jgi:hypothetical protein